MTAADVRALGETLPPDQAEGLRWALEALRRPFAYDAYTRPAAALFGEKDVPISEAHWWTDPDPDAWWQAQGATDVSEIPQPLLAAMALTKPIFRRNPTYHRAYPSARDAWLALAAAWPRLSARRRTVYLSRAGFARLNVLAAEMV